MASILRVDVDRQPGTDTVHAGGELDIAVVRDLWDALARVVAAGRATVLDLSGLRFCDLEGVRMLRDAAAAARSAGLAFRVHGVQGEVARLLGLVDVRLPVSEPASAIDPHRR